MAKLWKDQKYGLVASLFILSLATFLVGSFRAVTAQDIAKIESSARTRIAKESVETKRNGREQLFDRYIKTLLEKGYPEAAGMEQDQFLRYINPLREQFHDVDEVKDGHISFLIVIPERLVPLAKQMSLVVFDDKRGYTFLDPLDLRNADGVETPTAPYLIFDVENGAAMRNIAPDAAAKLLENEKQGRRGLTAMEGVALVTHYPETLKDHDIYLPGSRYGSIFVPYLWLIHDRPELNVYWSAHANLRSGAASCGSR